MIFAKLTVILVCIVDILILIIVNKYMKDVSLVEFFYNVSYHCGLSPSPGTVGALLNSSPTSYVCIVLNHNLCYLLYKVIFE